MDPGGCKNTDFDPEQCLEILVRREAYGHDCARLKAKVCLKIKVDYCLEK
jgi:hypothetical protein